MSPGVSGAVVGFVAGAAALGVVHAVAPLALAGPIGAAARAHGFDPAIAYGVAYIASAATGALVGATFAVVTRYLRKWFALLIWALVFFTSLAMLVLAATSASGRAVPPALSGPILLASAVFGLLLSFSLPIRRRR